MDSLHIGPVLAEGLYDLSSHGYHSGNYPSTLWTSKSDSYQLLHSSVHGRSVEPPCQTGRFQTETCSNENGTFPIIPCDPDSGRFPTVSCGESRTFQTLSCNTDNETFQTAGCDTDTEKGMCYIRLFKIDGWVDGKLI